MKIKLATSLSGPSVNKNAGEDYDCESAEECVRLSRANFGTPADAEAKAALKAANDADAKAAKEAEAAEKAAEEAALKQAAEQAAAEKALQPAGETQADAAS